MAADYFTNQEITRNLNKNYKPGDITRKATQHITGNPVLNTGQAKRAIAKFFSGGSIMKNRKSDGSLDKNALIKQLRDKYKMTNLTPRQRREFAEMIVGKGKVINKKALKAIEGYKKYTQRKMRDEGIGYDSAKKLARRERVQSKGSRGFAATLRSSRNKDEMSREEIKENALNRVLAKGGEKVGYKSLGIRDVKREESQLSALQGKNSGSPTVNNPVGVTSAVKSNTVGVGGGIGTMNKGDSSNKPKPISGSNMNNVSGRSSGSSLRGTPPPF